jgi:site-specific DNA-methyltransferase (adenine-specific)
MELNTIIHGDCFEVLKSYPDNFFDAVITDPPYGISFMNRKWDYQIPSVELWQEVLRVLKPGGHALVACGTRTQHRMAVNLEDAGFEIRDIVSWVYGSGFPKSLNVGKAIDKLEGNEREVVGEKLFCRSESNCYAQDEWTRQQAGKNIPITQGNSEWEGWGTALKPAVEFFTLCRKPLSESTVAKNVLKWGTGAINIDDCRVETNEIKQADSYGGRFAMWNKKGDNNGFTRHNGNGTAHHQGRFPANFIHDGSDEVVSLFPETKSGAKNLIGRPKISKNVYNLNLIEIKEYKSNEGSASRFFYCAKASPSERNMGYENKHPTVKPIKLMRYLVRLITPPDGIVLDPFGGSGTTAIACIEENKNYVLIERESEYIEIAEARINAVNKDRQLQLDIS